MANFSFLKSNTKPIAILGLGVSGLAVAETCLSSGVLFHAWDDTEANREKYKDRFPIVDFSNDLSGYEFLVPAAGIKPSHPVLQKAIAQNIQLHSDVDLLLLSAPDAISIAITGTNGKSTTTALIGHILQQAGKNVAVGGNIGKAACSLPSFDANGIYVIEMSSYMLEISANPVADIAVLLNITPDHLDWHGTLENYTAAKEKIFQQRANHAPQIKIFGYSMGRSKPELPILSEHPFLKGEHNQENIIAAIEACRAVGLDDATILKHLQSFEGLAHRQKRVAQYQNIEFINDSKATNTDSASKSLATFDNIYWIVGGMATDDKLNGLDVYFPKVKHAYLIGQASDEFAEILEGKVSYTKCDILKNAVTEAFRDAQKTTDHATILLATACKSWDQYKNFEQRGDDFVACVENLLKGQPS